VFAVAVGIFSLFAAGWDCRTHRVPNWLTIPMFLAGWAFQWWFAGWDGLREGALAFGLGFGLLFALWLIGSGGGGDVKLMGALSVWLGLRLTMLVLVVSTVVVLVGTILLVTGHLAARIFIRRNEVPEENEIAGARQRRRVMAYAIPVALATWAVMAFELPPV
jgi:prepilin peptidase CpaA